MVSRHSRQSRRFHRLAFCRMSPPHRLTLSGSPAVRFAFGVSRQRAVFFRWGIYKEVPRPDGSVLPVPLPRHALALLGPLICRSSGNLCPVEIHHRALFLEPYGGLGRGTAWGTGARDFSLRQPHFKARSGRIANGSARMDERVLSSPFLFRFCSRQSFVFPGWTHLRSLPIFLWAARCRGRDGPLVLPRSGNASPPGTHERWTLFARLGNIPAFAFCRCGWRKPGAFLSLWRHAAHRVSDHPSDSRRQCGIRLPHASTLGSCSRSRSSYRRG